MRRTASSCRKLSPAWASPRSLHSSDLSRARETAAPLAAAWGKVPVAMRGLREQHFGVLEGLDDVQEVYHNAALEE